MAKLKVFKYLLQKWLILPLLAVITFFLTEICASNPELVENIYGKKIYPLIARTFSGISALFPFSLDDIFYVLLVTLALVLLILSFTKKISFKHFGKIMMNTLSAIYILFYVLWGFNYFRPNLNQRINLKNGQPNSKEFLNVFHNLVIQTNETYTTFNDFDKNEIDSLIEKSYENLAPVLELKYPSGSRRAKNITFSRFFAQAGISGYYGPFFNEVQVNTFNLPVEYPFVMAHEKAHQFGITSEAEANFYSWVVCSHSNSVKLRYSVNLAILRYFIYQGYQLDGFEKETKNIDTRVKNDLRRIRDHWMQLRNEKIDHVASKVNDTYLKTNKVEKGVEDYYGVVKFVLDFQLDTTFQKKWNLN